MKKSSETLQEKQSKIVHTTDVNEMIFPVEKVQSPYESSTDSEFDVVVYPDAKPDGYRVASVADRYNLVDNTLFLTLRNALLAMGVVFEEYYEMTDFSQFSAKFVLRSMNGVDLGFSVGGNDKVYPQISMRKSYNSRIKYAFLFGFYRLICSNGLTIPVMEMKDFNWNYVGKHTEKLNENIETLGDKLNDYLVFAEKKNIAERFNALTKNTYVADYGDRVEEVMNATKIAKGISNKNMNKVLEYIESEAKTLNSDVNDWLIYNGINSFLYKDNVKTDEVRDVKDKEVLKYIMATA